MTEAIKEQLDTICQIIKETADVEKIYLFGSYAYGTPDKDSDFDLYVVVPDNGPKPIETAQNIYMALYGHCSMPLDILTDYASRFQWYKDQPTLQRKIVREGISLYDKDQRNVTQILGKYNDYTNYR